MISQPREYPGLTLEQIDALRALHELHGRDFVLRGGVSPIVTYALMRCASWAISPDHVEAVLFAAEAGLPFPLPV